MFLDYALVLQKVFDKMPRFFALSQELWNTAGLKLSSEDSSTMKVKRRCYPPGTGCSSLVG
jgi:hypothetical protein